MQSAFHRHRKDRGERACRQQRHQRGKDETQRNAAKGQHENLHEIDGENETARRAKALEGGNDTALGVQPGSNRIGHAHAADHQGGQADESQELGKALDVGC